MTMERTEVEMALNTIDPKEVLAANNIKLAHYVANKWRATGMEYEELYGVALLGLAKAVDSFNPDKGYKFATYGVFVMENTIKQELRKFRKHKKVRSLDETVYENEGNPIALIDTIADEERTDWLSVNELIEQALRNESQRNKEIFYKTFVENKTQKEIENDIGLSQAMVSRIVRKIQNRIKKMAG